MVEDKSVKAESEDVKEVFRVGNVTLTEWNGKFGVNYVLQKGYKKDGSWVNERVTLFPREFDFLVDCIEKKLAKDEGDVA